MLRTRSRILFSMLTLAATTPILAQQPVPPVAPSVISTSSRGEVRSVPDRAHILVSVQTRDVSAAAAASENAVKQSAVISALRALGITAAQISTQNYSVSPETRNDKADPTPRIVSYRVSNSLLIVVDDLSRVGKVIDTALEHGANQISSIDFFESNAQQLYLQALAMAVSNARHEAESMAAAAGGRLGPMLDLSAGGSRMPSPLMANSRLAAFAAETPIMPGQDLIEASVSGRWVFIPNP